MSEPRRDEDRTVVFSAASDPQVPGDATAPMNGNQGAAENTRAYAGENSAAERTGSMAAAARAAEQRAAADAQADDAAGLWDNPAADNVAWSAGDADDVWGNAADAGSDRTRVMPYNQVPASYPDPEKDPANPYREQPLTQTQLMPAAARQRTSAARRQSPYAADRDDAYDPRGYAAPSAPAPERGGRGPLSTRMLFALLGVGLALLIVAFLSLSSCSGNTEAGTNAVTSDTLAQDGATGTDGTASETDGTAASDANLYVDTSGIVGERWSNARKILEDRGADLGSVTVLTDDGQFVLNPSNWTVTSIGVENNVLTVYLTHASDEDTSTDASNGYGTDGTYGTDESGQTDDGLSLGDVGDALSGAQDALEGAGNAVDGANDLLGSAGDILGSLANGAQGLLDRLAN